MSEFDIQKIVANLKALLADTKANMEDNNGWDLGDIKDIFDAFVVVIALVEQATMDLNASGEDKRKVAIEALNWLIDVPAAPEWLEEQMFGIVVDFIVQSMNRFKPSWETSIGVLNGRPVI